MTLGVSAEPWTAVRQRWTTPADSQDHDARPTQPTLSQPIQPPPPWQPPWWPAWLVMAMVPRRHLVAREVRCMSRLRRLALGLSVLALLAGVAAAGHHRTDQAGRREVLRRDARRWVVL
jgi:hypothetical protein